MYFRSNLSEEDSVGHIVKKERSREGVQPGMAADYRQTAGLLQSHQKNGKGTYT